MEQLERDIRIAAFVAGGLGMGQHGCPRWRKIGRILSCSARKITKVRDNG